MTEDCTVTPKSVEVSGQERRYYNLGDEAACQHNSLLERQNCSHARAQRRRNSQGGRTA